MYQIVILDILLFYTKKKAQFVHKNAIGKFPFELLMKNKTKKLYARRTHMDKKKKKLTVSDLHVYK